MKILYIHSLYYPNISGGAEITLQILVEAMARKGHDVAVLTTTNKEGLSIDYVNGIKIYRAHLENIYNPFENKNISKLKKIRWHLNDRYNSTMVKYVQEVIDIEKPDLVSCHNLTGFSIAAWDTIKKNNLPLLQVLHDFYLMCINSNMCKGNSICTIPCLSCKLLRTNHKKATSKIDFVVGISEYILNKFNSNLYFQDIPQQVIYNVRLLSNLNLDIKKISSSFNFGYIGTLSQNKGIEWLIQEFKTIDRKYNISLLIAGKGNKEYVEYLQQLSHDDTRIKFLGFIKPEEFYPQINTLVVPSLWEEPLGMVAIEACAYQIPVITTGNGGLKEIIKDHYNGLICSYESNDLKEKLIYMVSNPKEYKAFIDATKTSVQHFLDKNRIVKEYESVYKYLLNTNHKY